MPSGQTYKVLGQSCPAVTTLVDLYTVPASTETVVSAIIVSNLTATAYTFRIAVRPAGATFDNKHLIATDVTIPANDSTKWGEGITLAATDVVSVRTSSANNVSFSIFGCELTA